MGYVGNVGLAIDKLGNALLSGSHAELLSTRAWRCGVRDDNPKKRWRIIRQVIDWGFFWEKNHCQKSFEATVARKQDYLRKVKELLK